MNAQAQEKTAQMHWEKLITSKRFGMEQYHDDRHHTRTDFQRDYDRLVFSAPFRRLQNKTQVFPLPGSIFVHNRLTHSLEVSCVGRSLGNNVSAVLSEKYKNEPWCYKLNHLGAITSAACLAHDLGNPPFGHSGERAIATYFSEGNGQIIKQELKNEYHWQDLTHFEGNANAFRLLTHQFQGRRPGGFALTYSTLASIVKYPYSSIQSTKKGKSGFFTSEKQDFLRIARDLGLLPDGDSGERYHRHPLVYLVEAADDICYEIMDIEDAHKLKILSYEETEHLFLDFFDEKGQNRIRQRIIDEGITDSNEKVVYMRACVIGTLEKACVETFLRYETDILNGELKGCLIDNIGDRRAEAYRKCADLSKQRIYKSKPVLDVELSGFRIMATLMEAMVDAAVNPERFYSRQLISRVSSQYDIDSPDLETRLMAVIDYISGMTDSYARTLYRELSGIE